MATRKSNDAQDKYDSLVLETIKSIDVKVDKIDDKADKLGEDININTHETKKINNRVGKLEAEVFSPVPQTIQQLPPIWRNPELIKLFTYLIGAVILGLVIYAGLKGIKIPGGFP